MSQANITLEFDGLSFEQVEHIRKIINIMFECGAFTIKNGKVLLHFDHDGVLQEVSVDHKRWKRLKAK